MSFALYISNIEYGPIWSFMYLFILTFSILFLFLIDQKKLFMFWSPKDKIMVLFMRIWEVNSHLLSLFWCLKIKMERRENDKRTSYKLTIMEQDPLSLNPSIQSNFYFYVRYLKFKNQIYTIYMSHIWLKMGENWRKTFSGNYLFFVQFKEMDI